jgi:3',5'-cyclic AMP phosphodiesterase CpdA
MRIRRLIILFFCSLLLSGLKPFRGSLAVPLLSITGAEKEKPEILRGPYLQSGSTSRITIKWRTDIPTDSKVCYGIHPDNLDMLTRNDDKQTDHAIVITGLKENTKYYYTFGNSEHQFGLGDPSFYFITAPGSEKKEPVRIWALGDFGTGDGAANRVKKAYLKYAAGQHTDVWLMLGDIAYYFGKDSEFQRGLFNNIYDDILRNTVSWSTPGNHDCVNADSKLQTGPYYDIFSLPMNGECGGVPSQTEAYYSFNYGKIHFISLDSEDSPLEVNGPMVSWLKKDLAENNSDWLIAFFHHPPYTKGTHNSDEKWDSYGSMVDLRENIIPILEAYGVDLVLSGHSHVYERSYLISNHYGYSESFNPSTMVLSQPEKGQRKTSHYTKLKNGSGTVYVVCGVGCHKPRGGTLDHPAMKISTDLYEGSLAIEVYSDKLIANFVTSKGKIKDSFTITKE